MSFRRFVLVVTEFHIRRAEIVLKADSCGERVFVKGKDRKFSLEKGVTSGTSWKKERYQAVPALSNSE